MGWELYNVQIGVKKENVAEGFYLERGGRAAHCGGARRLSVVYIESRAAARQ